MQAVARVGRYKALAEVGQWKQEGHFIGIDRVDFPEVVFWRSDFARSSLGSLMNALALAPNGVLVPNSFLQRMVLKEGDDLRIVVSIPEQRKELTWLEAPIDFRIVGSFDRFPSWVPDHGPAIVGNLDYVFESAGGQFPFDVWLRTEPEPDYYLIEQELREKGFRILGWEAPGPRVLQALRRPEFQGIVGLLSIGFIACTLLTILGFVLFTVSSFRERAIRNRRSARPRIYAPRGNFAHGMGANRHTPFRADCGYGDRNLDQRCLYSFSAERHRPHANTAAPGAPDPLAASLPGLYLSWDPLHLFHGTSDSLADAVPSYARHQNG